jgi:hypothetical protein
MAAGFGGHFLFDNYLQSITFLSVVMVFILIANLYKDHNNFYL